MTANIAGHSLPVVDPPSSRTLTISPSARFPITRAEATIALTNSAAPATADSNAQGCIRTRREMRLKPRAIAARTVTGCVSGWCVIVAFPGTR